MNLTIGLPKEVRRTLEVELIMQVECVTDRRPACEAIDVVFADPFPRDDWDSGFGLTANHIVGAAEQAAISLVAGQLGVEPAQLKAIRPVKGYRDTIVVVAARGLKLPVPAQPKLLDVAPAIS